MWRAGKARGLRHASPSRRSAPDAARDTAGFSLFELIIVLMIVALGGAFAVPAIQSGWRSREVREGTRQIAGVMRSLRERAVRRGVEQHLVFEPDGGTLRWADGAERRLPEGATISGVRGGWRDRDGSVRVVFYPNGGSNGVAVVVSGRDGDGLRFVVEVEPLLGSVVVDEASG